MPNNVTEILEKLRIQEWDEDIFEMSYSKLRKNFEFGSGKFYTTRCIRNLIWQDYQRIHRGELELDLGNIRSYWYTRLKPVLARARASKYAKKYDTMIKELVGMIVDHRLFNYADFGFTDENQHNRAIGDDNRHLFCIAEKSGHMPLLQRLQASYDITIIALGGQPSALSSEYLLRELNEAVFTPAEPIPLLTIVDYDPAGDSIVRSFIWQMTALGFDGEFVRTDLAHPSRMTANQIKLNKYRLSRRRNQKKKNQQWAGQTGGLEPYGHGLFYGLEADTMTWAQLIDAFDDEAAEHLDIPREVIVRRRLKRELVDVMKELLLKRLLG